MKSARASEIRAFGTLKSAVNLLGAIVIGASAARPCLGQDSLPSFHRLHAGMSIGELEYVLDTRLNRASCRVPMHGAATACYTTASIVDAPAEVAAYLDSESSDLIGTIIITLAQPTLTGVLEEYSRVAETWSHGWRVNTYTLPVFMRKGGLAPEGCGLTTAADGQESSATISVDCIALADNGSAPRLRVVLARRKRE